MACAVVVTFDLFGTLVSAARRDAPWEAVAIELAARDVRVPDDWEAAYRSSHLKAEPLQEVSLIEHTIAALASRGVNVSHATARDALIAAFDGPVEVLEAAPESVTAARDRGPVGILSNCSLPGLVAATLDRADLPGSFDAVVTSVGCGWRKPHDRAFHAGADALGVATRDLVHVGDDPRADGGGRTAGATVVLTTETRLSEFPAWLEARG